jgi:hypothetical protein
MEKYYVSYGIMQGSVESYYYDVLILAKDYDEVEGNLKDKLMKDQGVESSDINVYDILSEIDYFDLQSFRDLDIDTTWE